MSAAHLTAPLPSPFPSPSSQMDRFARWSKARKELSRRESLLDVVVLVATEADASGRCPSSEESPRITLSVAPDSFIRDLTRDACESLGLFPPEDFRLRRVRAAGGRGALLSSGAADTLQSQGIANGTELILERGRALARGEVEIWYRLPPRGSAQVDGGEEGSEGDEEAPVAAPVVVRRWDTVRELKRALCMAAGLAKPDDSIADVDARWHLSRTDAVRCPCL